jgi:hypothetical protein
LLCENENIQNPRIVQTRKRGGLKIKELNKNLNNWKSDVGDGPKVYRTRSGEVWVGGHQKWYRRTPKIKVNGRWKRNKYEDLVEGDDCTGIGFFFFVFLIFNFISPKT